MLYDAQQKTLFGIRNSQQGYLELINKKYNFQETIKILDKIDWDFKDFTTQYLTHTFHSYPARFIPQIPLTFIQIIYRRKRNCFRPNVWLWNNISRSIFE